MLVDDQPLFVDSVRIVLENSKRAEIEVVAVAHSGEEAIERCAEGRPDVVLVDNLMPGMNGAETTRAIRERDPHVKVIVLTTYDDEEYIFDAIKAGASGYLLKNVSAEDLEASVLNIAHGTMLISPAIVHALVNRSSGSSETGSAVESEAPELLQTLSSRERDVLAYAAKAYTNSEIADALFIAEQTVRNHMNSIYSKLGLHDRLHLIQFVNNRGGLGR
jgi:DNA-binding NarL/FixJ family response regulator